MKSWGKRYILSAEQQTKTIKKNKTVSPRDKIQSSFTLKIQLNKTGC